MGEHVESKLGVTVDGDGVDFRVWAPFAEEVWVTGSFNEWSRDANPMIKGGGGIWQTHVGGAKVGQEYKFIIKNGQKFLDRNDPRALQLTAAGDACIITDSQFDWQDHDFRIPPREEQVIYELHIGTFHRTDPATPGTFASAIEKLNYLRDLGVNVIEVMPVSGTNAERWWGYDPTFLYAVDAEYGGRKAFMEFIDAAHARGMAVVIDVVFNHLSPFDGLDLWQFDGWSENDKGGIYFYNDWRGDTPWGPRPDYGRSEVRQYLTENVQMWLRDCHADGIRVDAVFAIRNAAGRNDDPEHDLPDGWKLLQEINEAAVNIKPDAIRIGEDMSLNEWITKPVVMGGAGFAAQWESALPTKLRDVLNPIKDEDRHLGELAQWIGRRYNGDAFGRITFSESHDADANGHARAGAEISPGSPDDIYARRRSIIGAAIAMTAPGTPMIFQGQEFMEDGWFNHWKALDWQKADTHAGIVELHRHLIALRRNRHGNTRGLLGQGYDQMMCDDTTKLIAYHRWDQGGPQDDTVVIINFTNHPLTNYRFNFPRAGAWTIRLNSDWPGYSPDFTGVGDTQIVVKRTVGTVNIGPYSVLVLSQDA